MTTLTAIQAPPLLVVPVTERDHASGPEEASLTIVEYGDFECEHCAGAATLLTELRRELPDALRVVYRHFPLWDEHPHARKAAEAAEAAAAQGLFWEMHRRLFKSPELDDDALARAARKVGLDMKRFRHEMSESFHAGRVRADWLGGLRSGVQGTPTWFINGERYRGPMELSPLVAHLTRLAGTPKPQPAQERGTR
jgi:formate-nitrite transporter family protein